MYVDCVGVANYYGGGTMVLRGGGQWNVSVVTTARKGGLTTL